MKKNYKLAIVSAIVFSLASCSSRFSSIEELETTQNTTINSVSNAFSEEIEFDDLIIDSDYYKYAPDTVLANQFISSIQAGVLPTQEYKPATDQVKAESILSVFNKKALIDIYQPYGTTEGVKVVGKVYKKRSVTPENVKDSKFTNIIRSIKYFVADPISDVQVNVNVNGNTVLVKTDKKGYFTTAINTTSIKSGVNTIKANLATTKYKADELIQSFVADNSKSENLSIISDIDDTVKYTGVNNKIQMVKNILLGNSKTDKPYTGVSSLYKGIINGPKSNGTQCMHYVSGSPTQLYKRIKDFFTYQKFPEGSIDLKYSDSKIEAKTTDMFEYKTNRIRNIIKTYPNKKFVLFGDTTQKDTEVYVEMEKEFPDRVLGIYINNVNKFDQADERFKDVKLTSNALDAARDLLDKGLISQETVDKVSNEVGVAQ